LVSNSVPAAELNAFSGLPAPVQYRAMRLRVFDRTLLVRHTLAHFCAVHGIARSHKGTNSFG
jgi:hypothetical protein